ncbi:MAG: hypothetical protein ACRD0K_20955 [Egibacteraceae bacterium]
MATYGIHTDMYYKGVAGERIQELADRLFRLSQEAEREDAHDAALDLADVATQLLEVGVQMAGKRIAHGQQAQAPPSRLPPPDPLSRM